MKALQVKKELESLKILQIVKANRKKLKANFLDFLLRTTGSDDRARLFGSDPLW